MPQIKYAADALPLVTRADVGARSWKLYEEGYHYDTIVADSAADALAEARGNVDRANYEHGDESDYGTLWIHVRVICDETGEEDSDRVTCEPTEPDCDDGAEHDWGRHHVHGHGGGVIITECCLRCGCQRTTDTWAQDMSTGEQGLESVSYSYAR